MRAILALTTIGLALSSPSQAGTYQFSTYFYGYTGQETRPGIPLTATLSAPDAILASGHVTISADGVHPVHGPAGVTLTIMGENSWPLPFPTTPSLTFGVSFDADLDVMVSSMLYKGVDSWVDVSGTAGFANGFIGADDPRCNTDLASHLCWVSGQWIRTPEVTAAYSAMLDTRMPVPEPETWTMLFLGAIGALVFRYR